MIGRGRKRKVAEAVPIFGGSRPRPVGADIQMTAPKQPFNPEDSFVFPRVCSRFRAMSGNTIIAALRRMGDSGQDMTGHGFRSMASTLLNEQGWNGDAIERQLAHGERDAVGAA